jgi:hypothetical protein
MNGLFIFLGESFRLGGQGTRNRGSPESYNEQIKASQSHIEFIEKAKEKYNLNSVNVFITSYTTQFNNNLLDVYKKYLKCHIFYDNVIGLNNLFRHSINEINNRVDFNQYDFIMYIRIDLFLKQAFMDIFNPNINMILYPTICWKRDSVCGGHPRVNDMMLFIPKKYYSYLPNFLIGHETWSHLMNHTNLTYHDMDVIINTYHDSDSCKDYNPLYYIVNRSESNIFHSEGHTFNKHNF